MNYSKLSKEELHDLLGSLHSVSRYVGRLEHFLEFKSDNEVIKKATEKLEESFLIFKELNDTINKNELK